MAGQPKLESKLDCRVVVQNKNNRELKKTTMARAAAMLLNKLKVKRAEQWLCTFVIILHTFLCRPLENKNPDVK